jgi:phosphoribosyl-AMP cyclohydrolase
MRENVLVDAIQDNLSPSTAAQDETAVAFNDQGLVPVIVQEATSRDVLMLAWMNAEALRRTRETRRATYWSRSRQTLWVKGETSGHTQHVREVRHDCDGDALLLVVDQVGPACHTGTTTCFDDGTLVADDRQV